MNPTGNPEKYNGEIVNQYRQYKSLLNQKTWLFAAE